jgi:hypothetical protein
MIKNRDRWEERDLNPIAEYCAFSGVSASMSSEGREAFSSWAKTVTKTYPREGAVSLMFALVRLLFTGRFIVCFIDIRLFLRCGFASVSAVVRDYTIV